jgi:putative PIN family toxin of toxin-antitoxin system
MKRPQIIIDTNIVIAAQRSQKGASAKLMSLIGANLFDLHVSTPLILEYEEVLNRQRAELGLTMSDIGDLIDAICALAVRHKEIYFRWRPYLPDAKDEFILELAVKAQCDYIVTFNRKDFIGSEKFGVQIIDPKTFLQEIGAI